MPFICIFGYIIYNVKPTNNFRDGVKYNGDPTHIANMEKQHSAVMFKCKNKRQVKVCIYATALGGKEPQESCEVRTKSVHVCKCANYCL